MNVMQRTWYTGFLICSAFMQAHTARWSQESDSLYAWKLNKALSAFQRNLIFDFRPYFAFSFHLLLCFNFIYVRFIIQVFRGIYAISNTMNATPTRAWTMDSVWIISVDSRADAHMDTQANDAILRLVNSFYRILSILDRLQVEFSGCKDVWCSSQSFSINFMHVADACPCMCM